MSRGLLKLLNPEIVIGFLLASLFWIAVLGWQAAHAPSEIEKQKCYETAEQEGHKSEECKTMWERTTSDPVAFFTFWLVIFTGGLGISTVMLWLAGEKQIEFLRESSASQGRDMQASIAESIRAATAMEGVAQGIDLSVKATQSNIEMLRERTAMQMRAYVAVVIGSAVYQERDRQLRFEAKPVMINTGHTPAHNVRFQACSAILPIPVPDDFVYEPSDERGGAPLNPNQTFIMSAIVPGYVEDAEIEAIKRGTGKALVVWGIVTYRDVFGENHQTRFAHTITWLRDDSNILGYFNTHHNDTN
jgi:hypothetical protein